MVRTIIKLEIQTKVKYYYFIISINFQSNLKDDPSLLPLFLPLMSVTIPTFTTTIIISLLLVCAEEKSLPK